MTVDEVTHDLQNMDLSVILRVQKTKYKYVNHIQGGVPMTSITYVELDVHTTNYTA